ncbi:MAG: porin, partial [Bacteroidaceae bacterium]|nr:porin [Bacteroidaceae bacterium]
TFKPFKYFNVKATYTFGSMEKSMTSAEDRGTELNRFVGGAWYNNPEGFDVRAEYGMMNGAGVKEQGAYGLIGYHFGKILPIARWDWYQDRTNIANANNYNRILLGCTYQLTKNTKIQVNAAHTMYGDNNPGYKTAEQVQIMGLFKF